MADDQMRICEAAISYADMGFAVLPVWPPVNGKCGCGDPECRSPAKHPCGKFAPNGLENATKDGPVILSWFANGQVPNIAIRTGVESGNLVVDMDTRHGGDESLAALGELPRTATVATGGGGKHFYFRMPDADLRNSTGKLGPGLDIRANGGYVVAPPSRHVSGGEYKWLIDPRGGLADLPRHILDRLTEKPAKTTVSVAGTIPNGQRNSTLTSLAGTMRRRGMTEAAILAALKEENKRCQEPLSDKELEEITRSIGKKPPARANEETEPPIYRPRVRDLDALTPRILEWLWINMIPIGGYTTLASNPGVGKTSVMLDVATRLSRRLPMPLAPKDSARIGTTVFVGQEDSAERVLLPKLKSMGANLGKVKILTGVDVVRGTQVADEPFSLDGMLEVFDSLAATYTDLKLIVLDPVTDCLGPAVNPNCNQEVRRVLQPLNPWADAHDCAIVGITHLNKRKDDDAIYRTLGSMGFAAVARAVLAISIHPADADSPAWEKRRILTPVKQSYAPEGDSLVFRIDQSLQTLLWEAETLPMGADEALSGGNARKSTTKAEAWLKTQLDNAQGPVDSRTLKKRAQEYGVCSERNLTRAASRIRVTKASTGMGKSLISWWGRPGLDIDTWLQNQKTLEIVHV